MSNSHPTPLLPISIGRLAGLALMLVLAGAVPLLAQIAPDAEQPLASTVDSDRSEEEDEPFARISAKFGSASEVDIEGTPSHFDVTSTAFSVETPFVGLSYSKLEFDWQGAESLAFANGSDPPWESLEILSLAGNYFRELRPNLALMTGLGVNLAYEEQTSDAFSLDFLAGVLWRKSENWRFAFGVGYQWHPEVDLRFEILPLIGFSWREETDPGFSASFGIPDTELRYRFSPSSSLALSAEGGEDTIARLADDSSVAPQGYVEYSRTAIGLQYRHRFADRWHFSFGADFGVDGELRIHSRDGVRLFTEELESAIGYSIGLSASF